MTKIIVVEQPRQVVGVYQKGDKGDKGYSPIKGVDYFDGSDASVTKPNVEAVLIGEISSHTHIADGKKVDMVAGKGLSTNDYTTNEKSKLSGIAAGAEVNVQADWNEATNTADDYIKNKPSIPAVQVQTDWNAGSGMGQLLNKPTLGSISSYDIWVGTEAAYTALGIWDANTIYYTT